MWPVIFEFGPIKLYSFGLMAALAFLFGSRLLRLEMERRRYPEGTYSSYAIAALVGGFIGARLNYLFTHLEEFRADPRGAMFSGAGLVWYGGLVGGIVATWLLSRKHKRSFIELGDAFAPSLAGVYLLGRVGCFVSGDGDYGYATDVPWAMAFPNGIVPTMERVHPTPVYEVLMTLPILILLWRTRLRDWPVGRQFGLYLILTGLERFVVEFWRTNQRDVMGLTVAQVFGIGAMLLGGLLFSRRQPAARPASG